MEKNQLTLMRFAPSVLFLFFFSKQDLMDHIRGLEPVDPKKPVLVPGDPERLAMEHVDRVGAIKYTPDHITSYRKLAGQLNVVPMKPFNG